MFRFALFGIPILVDWWFWLSCVLLGGGAYAKNPNDWMRVALWTAVVFVSIIIHELGHALAGRRFGIRPVIKLHGLGGVTYLPGQNLTRARSVAVTAAGPLASVALGLLVLLLDRIIESRGYWTDAALRYALRINFVWTALNLLPIQPLDGGQILRELLGPRRAQVTAWTSAVLASILCVWSIAVGQYFWAVMLALLAYYNFRQEHIEGGVVKEGGP